MTAAVGRVVRAVGPFGDERECGAFRDAVIGRDAWAAVTRPAGGICGRSGGDVSDCDLGTSVPDWVIHHPETQAVYRGFGLDNGSGGRSLGQVAGPEAAMASLCDTCENAREVRTPRSRFLLCQLSFANAAYPKYPPQPVVRCDGHRPRGDGDEDGTADRRDGG